MCIGPVIAHGAGLGVVPSAHDSLELLVEPIHQRRRGAEVDGQLQRPQAHGVDARILGLLEQAHIGVAEAVDGLHGVADGEDAGVLLAGPALDQQLQQLELGAGGVLKFVDQDVADAVVQGQSQFRGCAVLLKGLPGGDVELGEVRAPLGPHFLVQIQHRQAEGGADGDEILDLLIVQAIFRQVGQRGEIFRNPQIPQLGDGRQGEFLLLLALGWKTLPLGERFAELAAAGHAQLLDRGPKGALGSLVGGGELHQPAQFLLQIGVQGSPENIDDGVGQLADIGVQGRGHGTGIFKMGVQQGLHRLQPLVAAGQHLDDQAAGHGVIVVQQHQEAAYFLG